MGDGELHVVGKLPAAFSELLGNHVKDVPKLALRACSGVEPIAWQPSMAGTYAT